MSDDISYSELTTLSGLVVPAGTGLSRRQAVVQTVNSNGTVKIRESGGSVDIDNVAVLASYVPVVAEVVWVLVDGADRLVIGPLTYGKAPRGRLGSAQITANVGSMANASQVTGLSVTVTLPANRKIKISVQGGAFNGQGVVNSGGFQVWVDGSPSGGPFDCRFEPNGTIGDGAYGSSFTEVSPSAGSHTFDVRMNWRFGTVNSFLAAGTAPGIILVEDIGGA